MLRIKSILTGVCFALILFPLSGYGRDPKLTLLCKGKPLCYWNVTLYKDDVVFGTGVTDDHGVVVFQGAKMVGSAFDLKGDKNTANGNKHWSVRGMFAFNDNSYTATIEFTDVAAQLASFMGISEANMLTGWGVLDDSCDEKPGSSSNSNSDSGSSSNTGSNTGSNTAKNQPAEKSMDEKMAEMHKQNQENMERMKAEREQREAQHKADLVTQKPALEQKLQRLDQKIATTKTELAGLTPGTKAHSDKSYDLRDMEIEREITEIQLDRNVDEQANNGTLKKSDRQQYNEKTEMLEDEQKKLYKNRKEGILYDQQPGEKKSADKKNENDKTKEEKEDDDDTPFKIYTQEELANMSSFDLKRTKLGNKNSVNKRKVKLKAKAAFLAEDKKAKINEEIVSLEKQIEAIRVILAQRNEKEEEPEKKE